MQQAQTNCRGKLESKKNEFSIQPTTSLAFVNKKSEHTDCDKPTKNMTKMMMMMMMKLVFDFAELGL